MPQIVRGWNSAALGWMGHLLVDARVLLALVVTMDWFKLQLGKHRNRVEQNFEAHTGVARL